MTNVLEAIYHIVSHQCFDIRSLHMGKNRANAMGGALEEYIKDAFAGTLGIADEQARLQAFDQQFSWLGSQNSPPDMMIRGGDAIEVKKTQNPKASLALNSSYPKANLQSTSRMITKECRECEDWQEKDLIYCIGHTSGTTLHSLWMVYGSLYAAKEDTYQRIATTISDISFALLSSLGIDRVKNGVEKGNMVPKPRCGCNPSSS